jgi:cobalt-precorrin 5A hydrolase
MTDPAVLVIDEKGKNCIPLVSGHIGGANEYAKEVEQLIGTHAVVTTATDLEQKFAVDVFAKKHNLVIADMEKAKAVSAKAVEKGRLWFYSDLPELFEINDLASDVHRTGNLANADIVITADKKIIREKLPVIQEDKKKAAEEKGGIGMVLIPKIYDLGIGCRRNAPIEDIRYLIDEVLDRLNTVPEAIHGIGSIDLKKDEPAFSRIRQTYHVAPKFFTAKELNEVQGDFTPSAFVKKITGVDNVCERSAVGVSGGKLVVRKTVYGNATAAAARCRMVWER